MSNAPPDLGKRLRDHRRQRGWTLQQMAAATGVAISTLSKVERGHMSPTYDKLLQLSRGLGVDIAEFFGPVFLARPTPPATRPAARAMP
jgi:transcriptional regulator with XRE-family HTH domain